MLTLVLDFDEPWVLWIDLNFIDIDKIEFKTKLMNTVRFFYLLCIYYPRVHEMNTIYQLNNQASNVLVAESEQLHGWQISLADYQVIFQCVLIFFYFINNFFSKLFFYL